MDQRMKELERRTPRDLTAKQGHDVSRASRRPAAHVGVLYSLLIYLTPITYTEWAIKNRPPTCQQIMSSKSNVHLKWITHVEI